jgi:hypothetical protein
VLVIQILQALFNLSLSIYGVHWRWLLNRLNHCLKGKASKGKVYTKKVSKYNNQAYNNLIIT